jgi:hypothetical protein
MKLKRLAASGQLELPVLVDVNAVTTSRPNANAGSVSMQQGAFSRASQQDLMIYEEIASNYFNSLRDN